MEDRRDFVRKAILLIAARVVAGIAVVALLFSLIFGFPFAKTPGDRIGLSYGGGFIEGAEYQDTVEPGAGRFFNGWFDKLYTYPVTQRNYIVSSREGEGDVGQPDAIVAPSKDNIATTFEVATYFKLNTDKIVEFHRNIGWKYEGWTDEGWNKLLNDSFRQQIESALQREARRYPVADLYADPDTLTDIQDSVGSTLKENVTRVLGDSYFCGPTFVAGGECPDFQFIVKRVGVPDRVSAAFESVRTSEIEVQTRQNEVEQARLQAQAIAELTQEENLTTEYVDLKYIEMLQSAVSDGRIQFWVLNGEGVSVTKQGPQPQQ